MFPVLFYLLHELLTGGPSVDVDGSYSQAPVLSRDVWLLTPWALPRVPARGVPAVGLSGVVGIVMFEHTMAIVLVPPGGFPLIVMVPPGGFPLYPTCLVHGIFGTLGTNRLSTNSES